MNFHQSAVIVSSGILSRSNISLNGMIYHEMMTVINELREYAGDIESALCLEGSIASTLSVGTSNVTVHT